MELFDAVAKAAAAIGALALLVLQLKSSWRQEELLEDLQQSFRSGELEVIRDEGCNHAGSRQDMRTSSGCYVLAPADVGVLSGSHGQEPTEDVTEGAG